ncbi:MULTISPECIES: hypothetical protein [unclassified Cedecea]|uniref:hypothetical protein n=1 Tax=unclassified Cedecea TaxID=2649846 RepID=UPI00301AB74E
MVTGKLIVVRINSTGSQYAYPESKYSELPTVSIDNGEPGHTNFGRHELVHMEKFGSAKRIGTATLALNITYDENQTDI